MAEKAKMGLTKEQFNSLCHEARLLHNYWREHNPSLYNQAVKDGDLFQLVSETGERMQDQMDDLMFYQHMTEQEAREIVWEDIYSSYQS